MNMGVLQYYFSIKALLWVLVVFVQTHEYMGCLEEERIGLLHLKSFLIISIPPHTQSDYLLPSWVDLEKSDCCGWERVTCNSTTGHHVVELSLDNLMPDPYYSLYLHSKREYFEEHRWLLNVSLFEPFKELRSLDLSLNGINGCIPDDQGFEKFSTLRNLEILNLGYNFFNDNSILQSLGAITSLKTLNLTANYLGGYFPAEVTLRNLNTLDISENEYSGTLPNQGFERLAVLRNLETLILDRNRFGYSILPSLSNLTSLMTLSLVRNFLWVDPDERVKATEGWKMLSRLEILDLSENSLNDTSFLQSIAAIKSLKNLNLADNCFTGSFGTKDLENLSKLEILDISRNSFTRSVLPSIWELFSLKALSLSSNRLNGTLPTREFCKLKKLEELDLSHNGFEGILPPCINNMTSLIFLDVSENHFIGDISSYLGASQTSLEYIDFSYNQFEGLFSLSLFANHSKLKVIRFLHGNNKLEIETENPVGWDPLFQLKVLQMTNCSLNKLASNIPTFLLDQHELEVIDLSYNKLKGSFPNWLVDNNTGLKGLVLRDNFFVGHLHFQLQQYTYISWMDVSNNHMEGKLQENIGKIFPNLNYLNLSHNYFEGNLPSSIGDMTYLEALDLSFNEFSGEIPRQLASNASLLVILNLAYNSFHGEILLEQLKSTCFLQMSGNQFTSILPMLHSTNCYFYYLDISHNDISGAFPKGLIGNITKLGTLLMANNSFYGQIPCDLSAIGTLDLSHNLFTGSLPVCMNLPKLEHLYLQGNKFIGSIPKVLFNSSSLLTLDMRDNSFSGSISVEIKQLRDLKVLLLSGNRFTGIIPHQLCLLKMISIMDLSKNNFFGTIPQCFHNISFGRIGATIFYYISRGGNLAQLRVPYTYKDNFLEKSVETDRSFTPSNAEVKIEFVTKYRSLSYKGVGLTLMSGLDLSCNNLTGGIPLELGQISSIIALNLSYNQLDGTIPKTFSNLAHLESLDLSHNNLSGEIPSSLINLNFLEVFNVAYNNLSGKVPDMKAQFGTFGKSSYKGNLFLCGPPLDKSCSKVNKSDPTPTQSSNAGDRKWYEVDPLVFRTSFLVSYIIFFITVVSLFYIIPYWLQRCYNFMEDLIYSCYYFVFDTSKRLSNCLCNI
ncbi:hypothetical protein I3842_01G050800 [Carya illinoinensis]|uniref:Leucine-rich repeat-containing N-terminal plant-type domain-containing protein n=1 Tax=Carya illinoinensis TaxID=32201 RepID=A0A922K3I1_CARIL|nr:hypothetical protein I3842_01G050800 [Carya illinoinensis]